jgi:hypothetical protein
MLTTLKQAVPKNEHVLLYFLHSQYIWECLPGRPGHCICPALLNEHLCTFGL